MSSCSEIWVKIEPKLSCYLPKLPKPHIINLKDIIDSEGGISLH